MHIGIKSDNPRNIYYMKQEEEEKQINTCDQEKDLGVIFDEKLDFNKHIESAIGKANQMLGLIKRTFSYLDKNVFLKLYKSMVRPHLEYGNIIWHPLYKKQSISIERVQRRATKLLRECKNMTYLQRLKYLHLHSLKGRRLRGDLIETFKIFNGYTDLSVDKFFMQTDSDRTRNSERKIFIQFYKNKIRRNFFSIRVAPHWNALTNTMKYAANTNMFKNLVDNDLMLREKFYSFDE